MPATPSRRSPRAPVRIVHLGLGAFHRAHQAWYTALADPDREWGIAAFTGRSPAAAAALERQDDVYTLLTRGSRGDTTETIETIVAAHDGADTDALCDYLARAEVTVVTLTVTEKGYRRATGGGLDFDDPEVASDQSVLAAAFTADTPTVARGALATMPGRLLWGLEARRRAVPDATIALIPCDNIDDNGPALRTVLRDLANTLSPALGDWLETQVDVVSTSVDRITPRTTTEEIDAAAARMGVRDDALVITEPFHSWILSGTVRGTRPRWEDAGAAFVSDIRPFERRKLWLLNGAHSSLAYEGLLRGHETVSDAISDPVCATRVRELWDLGEALLASAGSDLDLGGYRDALVERFSNPAIAHRLRQIVSDGSVKLRTRALDPLRRAREQGQDDAAARGLIDAWARFVVAETRAGRVLDDVAAAELTRRARAADPHLALLDFLAPDLDLGA